MSQGKSQNRVIKKDKKTEQLSVERAVALPRLKEDLLSQFRNPPTDYGPIDCWWWEAGPLDKDRMRWQLEEMKEKGVSGTWYYPRFVHGQPLSSDPQYWTEGWWEFTRFAVEEHQRLGLRQVPSPISMDGTGWGYAPIGAQVGDILHSRTWLGRMKTTH